jgi:hypothetical protein
LTAPSCATLGRAVLEELTGNLLFCFRDAMAASPFGITMYPADQLVTKRGRIDPKEKLPAPLHRLATAACN